MPIKRDGFPPHWQETCQRILQRAGHRCERCGVKNGRLYCRLVEHPDIAILDMPFLHRPGAVCGATVAEPELVVLAIAHRDRQLVNHADDNLIALCQRCHRQLDDPGPAANAAIERATKRRQPDLFADRQEDAS